MNKAKYIVEFRDTFTVCHNKTELKACDDYSCWNSSRVYHDASYSIQDNLLTVKGDVREDKWFHNIPYYEDGEGFLPYYRCERTIKKKYLWFFGPVVSDTMNAYCYKFIPYEVIASKFKLITKEY